MVKKEKFVVEVKGRPESTTVKYGYDPYRLKYKNILYIKAIMNMVIYQTDTDKIMSN